MCTAIVSLHNPDEGEFIGGLFAEVHGPKQELLVPLGLGDVLVHKFDLMHGVRIERGVRYSLIFWMKDCIESVRNFGTPWLDALAEKGDSDAQALVADALEKRYNSKAQDRESDARLLRFAK